MTGTETERVRREERRGGRKGQRGKGNLRERGGSPVLGEQEVSQDGDDEIVEPGRGRLLHFLVYFALIHFFRRRIAWRGSPMMFRFSPRAPRHQVDVI